MNRKGLIDAQYHCNKGQKRNDEQHADACYKLIHSLSPSRKMTASVAVMRRRSMIFFDSDQTEEKQRLTRR
jgi:ribonuclease PH